MLIYKQRYKPRTSRAFTKSDLTVYDSAGNTALNALTVYGNSEVVNNEIVSAGDSGSIEIETCGKNLLNPTKYYQRSSYTNIVANYTNNVIQVENITTGGRFIAWNIKTAPGEQVTISWTNTNNVIGIGIINTETFVNYWAGYGYSIDSGRTITSSTEWLQVYADMQVTEQATASITELQVEKGTSATAYEPYNGTMAVFETGTPLRGIPDTDVRDVMVWDGSAGTVTKNCAKVRLVDLTWEYIQGADYNVFRAPILNIKEPQSYSDRLKGLLCSKYAISTNPSYSGMNEKSILKNLSYIFIKDNRFNSTTDFVASLGDAELVYELATPTTQNLTTAENDSIAGLRTFAPSTHAQNNAQTDMTVDYTIRVPTI